jgi:mannose-1-phosphate guanylyltransferase
MIEHVVSILPESMVNQVLIASGYGIDQMRNHFENANLPYEVVIVEEKEPLGTGGAIANCRSYLTGERCVVINGDLLTSLRVDEMLAAHRVSGAMASISLWEVEDPSRFGVADYNSESGRILRFQEKPKREDAYSNLINAGTYILESEVFDRMPDGAFSMERIVFPEMAESGLLGGYPFEGHFVDAGTPESYLEAMNTLIGNKDWNRGHEANFEGLNKSWFGGKSKVFSSAKVTSSSVEDGCSIAEEAIVENSALLNGANIEFGAKITSCMVGQGARIGPNANLEGVVIDHDAIIPINYTQKGGVFPTPK